MSDSAPHEPARGQYRVYERPPVDGTDDEIVAWAEAFVDAVLGPLDPEPSTHRCL